MSSIGLAKDTITSWVTPILRYERHLSALAMVAGFGVDSVTFGRIDRPGAHLVFGSYLALAAITIATAHALQTRADQRAAATGAVAVDNGESAEADGTASAAIRNERWRKYLPAATQFALGGLWSGFLVFYSRSASLTASWLFVGTLVAFLIGNEIFRKYHSRLVFATLLLFFATYSYAVFTVPVVTHHIGKLTFLASGAIAIFVFLLFLRLLVALGRKRFAPARWQLLGGTAAIAIAMNLFYFTGILPPLPLALTKIGIFHSVKHTGATYQATTEAQPWYAVYGIFGRPVVHVASGEPISLYASVFAPIRLATRITHRWERYDDESGHWRTQSVVSFPISGGRDGGYRAYTIKSNPRPGDWRVDIETEDRRLIGRMRFTVAASPSPVSTSTITLN